jgi:opacity protein-like surface antigen
MGAGIFGAELDVAYADNFFGDGGGDNSLLTIMPSLIVGAPVGGTTGPGIRPYVTAGIGLLRRDLDLGDEGVFEDSSAAYSLGFGVMGFFTDHVGIRGDYRYFRNFEADEEADGDGIDFDAGTFNFSRAAAAVVFRF